MGRSTEATVAVFTMSGQLLLVFALFLSVCQPALTRHGQLQQKTDDGQEHQQHYHNLHYHGLYQAEREMQEIMKIADSTDASKEVTYHVTIRTGNIEDSGSTDKVSIVVVGDKASTQRVELDKKYFNDFQRDS